MDDEISKQYNLLLKRSILVLFVGIVLVILSPFLFTRDGGIIDFSETGQIGDTIGGITAPIVGLIGGFLVLISFLEQWKANRIQWNELKKMRHDKLQDERIELLWKLYNEVREDFNNNEIIEKYNTPIILGQKIGIEGTNLIITNLNPILNNFNHLLVLMAGMDNGKIKPEYAAIFKFKFENMFDSFSVIYNAIQAGAGKDIIKQHFEKIEPNLNKLGELKWA